MNLLDAEVTSHEGTTALQLSHTAVNIALSPEKQSILNKSTEDKRYVFGVRPEHIGASKEPSEGSPSAEVHLIEPLGSVNILDMLLGINQETQDPILLRVRTHPSFQVAVGDTIWLGFDAEHMHLFDRDTEQAIW